MRVEPTGIVDLLTTTVPGPSTGAISADDGLDRTRGRRPRRRPAASARTGTRPRRVRSRRSAAPTTKARAAREREPLGDQLGEPVLADRHLALLARRRVRRRCRRRSRRARGGPGTDRGGEADVPGPDDGNVTHLPAPSRLRRRAAGPRSLLGGIPASPTLAHASQSFTRRGVRVAPRAQAGQAGEAQTPRLSTTLIGGRATGRSRSAASSGATPLGSTPRHAARSRSARGG